MKFRFRPSEPALYGFFTRAAKNAERAALAVADIADVGKDADAVSARLVEIEHDNDNLTHELYNKIHSTFVTPFDREDMYSLGSRLDDVVDHLEGAATLVQLYGLFRTEAPPPEMCDQLTVLAKLGELTATAFEDFAAKRDMRKYLVGANSLENEGDRVYRLLLVRLFGGEYDALTVLKMKEVADELEEAADAFEHVANTVEAIVVKES
jgi:predicted phosphate transport protein (TIGR00153 family)